jgi:hypothetical protein
VFPDEDARWPLDTFKAVPIKRDVKIGRAPPT